MLSLPGVTLRFSKASIGTAPALRRQTLPIPTRTAFETKLKIYFENCLLAPYGALIVILTDNDGKKANPDYEFAPIPLHVSAWRMINHYNRTNRPVMMALDTQTGRPLSEQIGFIPPSAHPAHFKSHPLISLPPPVEAPPAVIHRERDRMVIAHHLRVVPGSAA